MLMYIRRIRSRKGVGIFGEKKIYLYISKMNLFKSVVNTKS